MSVLRAILVSVVAFAGATLLSSPPAAASGGISSIWAEGVTDHSVNIRWSDPDPQEYRYWGNGTIAICYKKYGDKGKYCSGDNGNGQSFLRNPQHLVTIFQLAPSTKYVFVAYSEFQKKRNNGKWSKTKNRLLGSVTVTTNADYTPTYIDWLVARGWGDNRIQATTWTSHNWDYEFVRVGYKLRWSKWNLRNITSARNGPASAWGASDSHRGWIDVPNQTSQLETIIDSLETCRLYTVVAYGFRPSQQAGDFMGEAGAKTGAHCSIWDLLTSFIDDHEDELESYANAVSDYYCPRIVQCDSMVIFNHLAAQYPQLYDDYLGMAADGEMPTSEMETIQYLEHTHRDIFDAWQSEESLGAAGMTMVEYLEREHPTLYASLLVDTAEKPIVEPPVPTVFPNPFNPETTIAFDVETLGPVTLSIYDVAGRLIRTLLDETLVEGKHTKRWDGRDNHGRPVSSGTYFARLVVNNVAQTNKLVLMK